MIRNLKIAFAAALIAAVTVPMFSAASQAAPSFSQVYVDRHGTNGW